MADGNYEKAVKSLAKVEHEARLYEAEAEGMSELALLLRDMTSDSMRDECVRLYDVAQGCILQHQAERAEGRPVVRQEVGQAGGAIRSAVSGSSVVPRGCAGHGVGVRASSGVCSRDGQSGSVSRSGRRSCLRGLHCFGVVRWNGGDKLFWPAGEDRLR